MHREKMPTKYLSGECFYNYKCKEAGGIITAEEHTSVFCFLLKLIQADSFVGGGNAIGILRQKNSSIL